MRTDLPRDRQSFVERHGSAPDALRQIVAFDELHHEGGHAAAFFETVNAGNVRVIQRREHFSFALKLREPIGVGCEGRRQDLDRNLALESRVGRPEYQPHPAFAKRCGDVVDAETRAGSRGQMSGQ
jgi:hypothetical protein